MTKRILAALVVLLLAGTIGLVAGCGGNLPKDAVAKVGGVMITKKDFDQRVADFETQYAGQVPDKESQSDQYKGFQQDVLEYMVTLELAGQWAKQNSVAVTDEDVQKEIDGILQDMFAGDQTAFDEALLQQGVTLDQLKSSYKESMLVQKVYEAVTKDVTTVPDADLQAYYDERKSEYYVAETRSARHILLAPDTGRVDGTTSTATTSTTVAGDTSTSASTPTASSSTTATSEPGDAEWNDALEAAKLVQSQLKAGADWTAEAKAYSDDPGSKETGGDLGTFGKGQMVQEFEEAAFSLEKDEISEPVKSVFGYHIIQVTGINEAKQYTLDEVKEEITSILLSEKQNETWQDWIKDQKAKVGVVYAEPWVTTTTTSAAEATDTTVTTGQETLTTAAGTTVSTAAPTTATTAAATTSTTGGTTSTSGGSTSTSGDDGPGGDD